MVSPQMMVYGKFFLLVLTGAVVETVVLKWFLPKLRNLQAILVTFTGNLAIFFAAAPLGVGALYMVYSYLGEEVTRNTVPTPAISILFFLTMYAVSVGTQLIVDRYSLYVSFGQLRMPVAIGKLITVSAYFWYFFWH